MSTELDCEPLSLVAMERVNKSYSEVYGEDADITVECGSVTLVSESGCSYGLDVVLNSPLVRKGGAIWADVLTLTTLILGNDDGTKRHAHLDDNEGCNCREIIFISTPWFTKDALLTESGTFSSNFTVSAQSCLARYYMANMSVRASISKTVSEISFDEKEYAAQRKPISDTFLPVRELQNLTLQPEWEGYMGTPQGHPRPSFRGPSNVLAALYDFNLPTMIDSNKTSLVAAAIKQRFFGEVLLSSIAQQNGTRSEGFIGRAGTRATRILVVEGVAFTLAAVLFTSFGLLLMVWRFSRLQFRPLNLPMDPSTTMGTICLLHTEVMKPSALWNIFQSSREDMRRHLKGIYYHSTTAALHELNLNSNGDPGKANRPSTATRD